MLYFGGIWNLGYIQGADTQTRFYLLHIEQAIQ
jgi:hypothetical protein